MNLHIKSIFAVRDLQSVVIRGWGRSPLKSSMSLLFVQHWGCNRRPTRVLEPIPEATNTVFVFSLFKDKPCGSLSASSVLSLFFLFFIRVRYPKNLVRAKVQMSSLLALCFLFTSQHPLIKCLQINSRFCITDCELIAELSRRNSHRFIFTKQQTESFF